MKKEEGIVFDLDGVLLDSETNLNWLYTAFKKTLIECDIDVSEENLQKIHSKNLYKFDKISEEFGVKPLDMWEVRNKNYIKEKIKAMKNREIFPFPDVKSLYRLKDIYGLSIVSDSPQEIVDFFIKEFDYKDLFECSVGRGTNLEDLEKMKPSPLALARLLENIQHEKLTYVGDSEKDHEFAEKTHMDFIFLSRKKDTDFNSLDKVVYHLLH